MDAGQTIANRFAVHDRNEDLLGCATDTLTGDLVAIKALDAHVGGG